MRKLAAIVEVSIEDDDQSDGEGLVYVITEALNRGFEALAAETGVKWPRDFRVWEVVGVVPKTRF